MLDDGFEEYIPTEVEDIIGPIFNDVTVTTSGTVNIESSDSGMVYLNLGATGDVTYNLPAADEDGLFFTFVCRNGSHSNHIWPDSGDTIHHGLTSHTVDYGLQKGGTSSAITLVSKIDGTWWQVMLSNSDWSPEAP